MSTPLIKIEYVEDNLLKSAMLKKAHKDTIGWELEANRRGWPLTAFTLASTWIAWKILRRENELKESDFDRFVNAVESVTFVNADGSPWKPEEVIEDDDADPFPASH